MFGATNASNVQEAPSASNRQINAGRGKYKRHNGVDYLVEWEEEYEGQWGKQKKQWVRDIDIVTPQIIEQYKQSQSLMENKDTDDKYEDYRNDINQQFANMESANFIMTESDAIKLIKVPGVVSVQPFIIPFDKTERVYLPRRCSHRAKGEKVLYRA
jgi:hypothetical protein